MTTEQSWVVSTQLFLKHRGKGKVLRREQQRMGVASLRFQVAVFIHQEDLGRCESAVCKGE